MKNKPKLFDVFLFLNELDLLDLRLKTLYSIVDYFIITEINETFSGKPKSLIFEKNRKNVFLGNPKLEPGDTIVVPRKITSDSTVIRSLAPVMQILSDLSFSAAALDNLTSN